MFLSALMEDGVASTLPAGDTEVHSKRQETISSLCQNEEGGKSLPVRIAVSDSAERFIINAEEVATQRYTP